jgi:hypothetical protein
MTKKTLIIVAATVAMGLSFTGCASTAESMQQQGYGPDYSKGYGDGCTSGKKAGGALLLDFTKNVDRYDNNGKYREGWDDGYKTCKSQQNQLERAVEDSSRDQAIRDLNK